jgi:hypothetical protein
MACKGQGLNGPAVPVGRSVLVAENRSARGVRDLGAAC